MPRADKQYSIQAYRRKFCEAVVFILFVLMLSCDDQKNDSSSSAEEILKSSGKGDFRGVNMGDQIENVRKTEGSGFVYSMPDELVYRIPASGLDSIWYEISYNFNEQGLYNINLEVFGKDQHALENLAVSFEEHYQSLYGPPTENKSVFRWRTMTDNGRYVNISLKDSLVVKNTPCIQVNFNESEK